MEMDKEYEIVIHTMIKNGIQITNNHKKFSKTYENLKRKK